MKIFVACALLVALAVAQDAQPQPPQQPQQPSPQQPQQPQQPSPQQPLTPQQPDAADSQPSPQQPGSPQQPAGGQGQGQGQGQHDALRLRCQAENGTVPYWLDKTCRAYLSCTNFNLSMQTCEDGRAYSYPHRSCLNADLVNCSAQNEEFATIIRAFLAPHFYQNIPRPNLPLVPFAANNGGTLNGQAGDQGLDGVVGEEGEEEEDGVAGMTIDLDDLPSILVDTSNALNITLPSETCERLNNQTRQLETSINTALLMLIGCPERSCDVPLFRIDC